MTASTACVLEHARVVHRDRAVAEPLAFVRGRVVLQVEDAFRVDLTGHLVFPGLINAHDHLQLNNIPALAHDGPFPNSYAWIDAIAAHRRTPAVEAATSVPSALRHWQGALKNVLAGVTTVVHHDPWHTTFDDPCFPVTVARDIGWSHSLGLGLADEATGRPRYGPVIRESFAATPLGQPWIIHLAEGTDDVARAELAQLDALGCLSERTVLVHGVGLTPGDVSRVIADGAAVVWCPSSNLQMLGRTPNPDRLVGAKRLALGTDSRLTGSRDLLDELRVAAMHSSLTARELIALVTYAASAVLRIRDCGGLRQGQRADCLIIRDDGDPHAALLRTRRADVRAVVRAGLPVIADPDFEPWFSHFGIATTAVHLDGHAKLLARHLARPDIAALEPGLEIVQ